MAKKPTNHLLVIRLSAMGDVAISVPVLMALTQQYPELRLTVLTRPLFTPLFAHRPNTEVFPIDPRDGIRDSGGCTTCSENSKHWKLTR